VSCCVRIHPVNDLIYSDKDKVVAQRICVRSIDLCRGRKSHPLSPTVYADYPDVERTSAIAVFSLLCHYSTDTHQLQLNLLNYGHNQFTSASGDAKSAGPFQHLATGIGDDQTIFHRIPRFDPVDT
jgi:hypothetical protein